MQPADVPAGPIVIDTDVFSAMLRGKDRHEEYSALLQGHLPVLAFPTVGELLTGAEKAGWQQKSLDELHLAIAAAVVLRSTDEVIEEYSHLHWRFAEKLAKKGHNDMWIAACVLAQPAPPSLMTNNLKDFQKISKEFPITLVHPDL